MQMAKHPMVRGKAHSTTRPKVWFKRNMQYMLPNISIEVRIMPRTNWETKFCIWVMSLVTRVTNQPVPNWSSWGKENCIIRRKQSLRISLPMFWPDM